MQFQPSLKDLSNSSPCPPQRLDLNGAPPSLIDASHVWHRGRWNHPRCASLINIGNRALLYEDGLGPAKAFWKWGDQLSQVTRELWYQHTSYELTTRVLLSPITTDAELDEMMSDSRSRLWKSGSMGSQLQRKLGPAYKAYLYTMTEMEEIMKNIAENLDIDKAATVPLSSPRLPHMHMLTLRALGDPQRTRSTYSCKPSYLYLRPRCHQV
jgi:hypothetical protein